MNEEAIRELYSLAQGEGYSDSFDEFKQLMNSNQEAINDMYNIAKGEGYADSKEDFQVLVGFGSSDNIIEETEVASSAVPEKKNPFESDPDLPGEQEAPADLASPSQLEPQNISSESFLTEETFNESDPFAQTILSDDFNKDLADNSFAASVNSITPELTGDREEEQVVPEMNYKFNQYGFTFEETGIGDKMKVKSANGEEISIPLDAFGVPFADALELGAKSRANKLRDFLIKNKEASEKAFIEASKKEERKLNKIQNKEELVSLNTLFNTQVDRFAKDVKNYSAEKLRLDKIYKATFAGKTPAELEADPYYKQYVEATNNLNSARTSLVNRQKTFATKGAQLDEMVGEYTLMQSKAGGAGQFVERLGNSLLEGTGGAFLSMFEEIGAFVAPKLKNFDASESRAAADEHVDYAVAQLLNNTDGYTLDDINLLTAEQADELQQIKGLLSKGTLDVVEEKKLKSLLSEFSPKDLQVVLENIETKDGDNLHSLTESIYEDVATKAIREYEETEIQTAVKGRPDLIATEFISPYEKAKSAAMGGAFNVNQYTGRLTYLDLEEGSRDKFRTFFSKYIGQEDDAQAAYRKTIKNSGNDLQKAMHGVAYSIPAFVGLLKTGAKKGIELTAKYGPKLGEKILKDRKFQNKASRVLRLMSQSNEAQMNKMANNPNFDNIDLDEQRAVAVPVAITTAVLEDIGFRNILNSGGLVNSLAARAIGKFSKAKAVNPNVGSKTFADFVRKDIDQLVSGKLKRAALKGGLTIAAGGAAEFETGALQSIGEMSAEMLYNNYKKYFDGVNKKMFDTPESITEFAREVMYQGYLEMLGGKIMAIPTAISTMASNPNDLNLVTDEAFEMFTGMLKDPQYKKMFVTNLKQRVADPNDKLTQKDADELLNTFNKIEGLAPKIPVDFTIQQQRQALNLLMEKQQLESSIEGKAPELVVEKKARIAEINEQLSDITLQAAAEQESALEAEQSIPELGATEVKTEESVETDTSITPEEKQDIEQMFGTEETVETEEKIEPNLFFNRKGKPKGALNNEQTSMRNKVINKAVNAAKSLAKNFNTKIVLHESSEEFNKATGRSGRGFYDFDNKTIHIDMNKANESTVAHEVFHAVLFERLGEKNIAEAVNRLTTSTMKALDKNSLLYKKIDNFAKLYKQEGDSIQNEERLAELFGEMAGRYERLQAPAQNAIINFVKQVGKALGINVGDIVNKGDVEVVNFLNTLADKVQTGQEIFTNELKILDKSAPYSESGAAVTVDPKAKPIKPKGRESRVYTSDRVGKYNVQSLNDFVTLHDGNVYVITSDATKLGKVEETGQMLDGGFGYSLIAQNMEDGVGFASLDATTAEKNMNKLKSKFKTGDKVGVLIMIQTPDAMYGNMYGAEYFYNEIAKLQKTDPDAYASYSTALAQYENTKMGKKGKRALTEETQKAIIDPSSVTQEEFVELMKNENFDRRRYYMAGVVPSAPTLKVNKSTPEYKKALLNQGTNTQKFNLTYGDKALLGESFLKENKGGYLVGGFTYVVPENTQQLVDETQNKGFTHPFFQGKVPAVANSQVLLDGLYNVATTLQPYMPDTLLVDKTKTQEINERVREQFTEDKAYDTSRIEGKPLEERTYTDLKAVNKIKFKANNTDLMVTGKANAVSLIAQSKPPIFEQVTEEITDTPRGREQKEIVDIVNEGRDSNFRDEVIKDYLVRVKKYPAKLVNKIMEVDVDLFKTLPKSFANMQGGVEFGLKLYKRVKAFEQKLIKSNKRKKVKLTEQQIADQTIEFLQKQPEYKNEGDGTKALTTKQAQLQVEFQRSVGTRTSESVQEKLTEARRMLQQRKRGAADLQSVKVAMRNFLRKSLPADLYTRSEVMSLIRKITDAGSTAQVENLFDEIVEFVNTKNNTRLEQKINSILKGKYETTQSGRKKAAKISLSIKERIQRIAKDRLTSDASVEQIESTNQNLTEEFNKINQKDILSEGDISRLVDIQILLNLNNSLLMENNDVNKTGSLDVALASLTEMIEQGRSELKQQLQESHDKYNEQASVAYEEVTGQEVDLGDPDAKAEVDLSNQKLLNQKRNKTKKVIGKFVNTLKTTVKKFFNETEALDGLMDLVSKLPGEMFGGRLQDMVTARVDASSRMYKKRMMQQEEILTKKFEELYGKKWRKQVRNHNKPQQAYVLDAEAVAKAKEDFNNDPSLENKQKLKQVLAENVVEMSQNEMLYYYNLYKDPANKGSFEATFGKDYARIMEEMESNMDDSVKEFGDWQVNEFYPSLYSHYNNTYKALYRTNMPWNRYYSGMIYRTDTQGNPVEQNPLDLLADKSIMNTSVGASSTKSRVQNNLPIRQMNSMNVMATYLRDMEYFAAYGETIRDIDKMFKNKQVKTAIAAIHGDYVNRLISNMIGKIANQGVRTNAGDRFVNKMNNLFIFSRIGLNPTVMIKQLTSMITYANDIGYANWLKYSLKTIPQIKKTFKEISENSVYMQDRNKQSITRVIESYTNDGMIEMVPNQYWDNYVNFIMYTTKFGDKAAIYLGGMPNYLYYKDQALKRGLSEEQAKKEAVLKFEKDTKRTQQSMDLQDRDFYQTAGALQRGLNMFLTTPKQYLRKEIQATRNLYRKLKAWDRNAGKGTLSENIRTFITYHFVAPVLFQYVSLGLPGLLRPVRDDDEDDLLRAAIIGNLNALFIVGEVISGTADLLQGKPYAGESVRSIAPLMQLQRLQKLAKRAMDTKDKKKAKEAYAKLYVELAASTGLPATQIHKFIKNMQELGEDGDIGKDLLRLLNFSPYVIEGPKKKKGSSKTLSIAEQNAQYFKEQERLKRQSQSLGNRRGDRDTQSRRRRTGGGRRTRRQRR